MPTISDRLNGISTSTAIKAPCKAVSAANLTLSAEQTVNGIACVEGDRVIVRAQTDAIENGIWVVQTGAWYRAADFDGNRDIVQGTIIQLFNGVAPGVLYEVTTDNPIVIGTSEIAISIKDSANIEYEQTQAEIDALATPVAYQYFGDDTLAVNVFRFMTAAQIADVVSDGESLDVSAALTTAISIGKPLLFPDGTYMANNLEVDNARQTLHFFGNATIKKNANGPLITFSAGQNAVYNGRFDGNGATFTGDNIVKSNQNLTLDCCSSLNAEGRAVYDSNGNGLRIMSTNSIYHTLDTSADGWDIVVEGSGIYCRIIGITTSVHTGGIYFNQTGAGGSHAIQASQFGKLKMAGGTSGNNVLGNRVGGLVNIEKSQVHLDGNAFATASNPITIGDGSTAFSGIVWGAGNIMTSGTELILADGLIDCTFMGLGQLRNNGTTITDNTTDVNDIYDARASYAVAWTDASGGTNAIENGSLQSFYTQRGRKMSVQIHLQIGSSTTFGSGGQWDFSLPKALSSVLGRQVGTAYMVDATGDHYVGVADSAASTSTVRVIIPNPSFAAVTKTTPFTWANGDRLIINFEYEL